jgi:malate dehydrogenase (oxaloacetate-decarboxylating)
MRVTDAMILAAARELTCHLPTIQDKEASLLPPLSAARSIARRIALAVGRQAISDGQAQVPDEAALTSEIDANTWMPAYVPYVRRFL